MNLHCFTNLIKILPKFFIFETTLLIFEQIFATVLKKIAFWINLIYVSQI